MATRVLQPQLNRNQSSSAPAQPQLNNVHLYIHCMYTYLFADCFPGGFQETSSTPKTSSFPLLDEWFLLKVSISVECKLSSIFFNAKFPWNLTVLFTKVAQKIMSVYFHSNWTECYTFLLSSWLSAKDAIIKQTHDWLKLSLWRPAEGLSWALGSA